jgi:hypothetical protein
MGWWKACRRFGGVAGVMGDALRRGVCKNRLELQLLVVHGFLQRFAQNSVLFNFQKV